LKWLYCRKDNYFNYENALFASGYVCPVAGTCFAESGINAAVMSNMVMKLILPLNQ